MRWVEGGAGQLPGSGLLHRDESDAPEDIYSTMLNDINEHLKLWTRGFSLAYYS